jgi:hypothetical protein
MRISQGNGNVHEAWDQGRLGALEILHHVA